MPLDNTPISAENSKIRMADKIADCDAAIQITFVHDVDADGKDTLVPTINYHNINLATLMMAHDIMHRGYSQRIEYVMLDYARMLRDEGTSDKGESNEEGSPDPGDGVGPGTDTGDGANNG